MLSPTSQRSSHRTLTTGTIFAVTIIILLTLYNLRDVKGASIGSIVQLASDRKDTAGTASQEATKSRPPLSHTPGSDQEKVKIGADNAFSFAITASSAVDVAISSTPATPNEPRRAFVTFLEADTGTNHGDEAQGSNPDDEDIYFVGGLQRPGSLASPNPIADLNQPPAFSATNSCTSLKLDQTHPFHTSSSFPMKFPNRSAQDLRKMAQKSW